MKQMKRFLGLFLAMLLLASTITAMAADPIRVVLYGNEITFDVPPQIINSRTMVPLRAIFEALGASVEWNDETRTVTSVKDDVTIQLTIDQATMYLNGDPVTLDSPACIVDGRTLVPVRAISEAFGISVEWFADKQAVALGSDDGVYENPLFHNGLVPFIENDKYGYLNKKGEIVIEPQFDGITVFSNGFALASVDNVWYSIDTAGNIIREIPYSVWSMTDDLVTIVPKEGPVNKLGCINTKGEIIIPVEYENLYSFHEGLAGAYQDGKWGFINKANEWVIAPQFDYVEHFSEGLAMAVKEEKAGYINPRGEWVIAPQFDYGNSFAEGLVAVSLDEKTGYMNTRGEWVVGLTYDYGMDFSDGMAAIGQDTGEYSMYWGYIDTQGKLVVPVQYENCGDFSEGFAAVCVNGKWGYINTAGEMVVPPQFDYGGPFKNGYAIVEVDGKYGFISTSGYYAITPRYPDATARFSDDGYCIVWDEEYDAYIIDKNGNAVSDTYDYILNW